MASEVNETSATAQELLSQVFLVRQMALCFDPKSPEQTREYREKIVETAQRSARQIEDWARLAKLERGAFVLEPVAIRGVCEEVSAELSEIFRLHGKAIKLKFYNHKKLVIGNRELIYSIIYNFCLNAVNYASNKDVLELNVRGSQDRVRVEIRDFGPLIPFRVAEQIRRDEITSPVKIPLRPDASGMAIFSALNFARYMGGRIGAIRHSDGMTFFLETQVSKQARLF